MAQANICGIKCDRQTAKGLITNWLERAPIAYNYASEKDSHNIKEWEQAPENRFALFRDMLRCGSIVAQARETEPQ